METVNFAFIKFFDFLVKKDHFLANFPFPRRFVSQIMAENRARWLHKRANYCATELDFWPKFVTLITQKKQKSPKNGYFDSQIKKFYKSKVDGLQKLSTRACSYHDLMHFWGCLFTKDEILPKSIIRFLKFFLNPTSMTF